MKLRIRYWRIRKGLSQKQLAKVANVSPTTINTMETDERYNPYPGTLKKIAEALGVSIDDLIEEDSRELQKTS